MRPDLKVRVTGDVLYQMTYTRQVVKEVLRYRAPAPMVPMIAQKPFQLNDDYAVPKGTLIMPSIHAACLQVCSAQSLLCCYPVTLLEQKFSTGILLRLAKNWELQ